MVKAISLILVQVVIKNKNQKNKKIKKNSKNK